MPVWAWLLMRTSVPCSRARARCQGRMYARRMFQKTLANTPTHPYEGPHQKWCNGWDCGGRCGAPAHRRHSIKCTSRRRCSPSPNPLGASWTSTRRCGRCGRVVDLMLEHCNSCISFSARFGPLRPTRGQNMDQKKRVPCSFDQNASRYKVFGAGYLTDGIVGASCAIQNPYM